MYKWNNEPKFQTLKISSKENILIYEAGEEKAEIYITGNDIEKVICYHQGKETVIDKTKVVKITPGEGNTQRDVFHYVLPGGPLPTFRIGITKHLKASTWSSLPHKFELDTEPGFEEAFFYLLKGGNKRAIQVGKGVWCDNSPVDGAWQVENMSWGTIPMGYHPVVGEPGVEVSYIWVYLCKKPEWEKVKKDDSTNEHINI